MVCFGLAIVRRACRRTLAGLFVRVLRCVITTSQKERQRGRLQQCSRSMFQDRNATKLQPDPFDLLFPSPSQKGPEADVLASSTKSSLETSKVLQVKGLNCNGSLNGASRLAAVAAKCPFAGMSFLVGTLSLHVIVGPFTSGSEIVMV